MRAVLTDMNGLITNVILVNDLTDVEGATGCSMWATIGGHINDPAPEGWFETMPPEGNAEIAQEKLAATSFVADPGLINIDEFAVYRAWLIDFIANPTPGLVEWPTEPTPIWGSADFTLQYNTQPETLFYQGSALPKTIISGTQFVEFDLSSLINQTAVDVIEVNGDSSGFLEISPNLSYTFKLGAPILKIYDIQGSGEVDITVRISIAP